MTPRMNARDVEHLILFPQKRGEVTASKPEPVRIALETQNPAHSAGAEPFA